MNNYITEEVYNQLSDTDKEGWKEQWEQKNSFITDKWTPVEELTYKVHKNYEIFAKTIKALNTTLQGRPLRTRLVYIPIHPTPDREPEENKLSEEVMHNGELNPWAVIVNHKCDGDFIRTDKVVEMLLHVFKLNNKTQIAVIRENLTTEQASNYGEVAGIKTAEEMAEDSYNNFTKLVPFEATEQGVYESGYLAGRTYTLNALRGIIEAEIPKYYNSLHSWQDANPMQLKERILTEIKKLQP